MKTKWQRFWSNPYKWGLWHWIGGRPWTWIYQDVWHKYEWFPQMQWAVTGIGFECLRQWLGWPWWTHFIWIGIYTYGYINGHFFWGKNYIPNQGGD